MNMDLTSAQAPAGALGSRSVGFTLASSLAASVHCLYMSLRRAFSSCSMNDLRGQRGGVRLR